MGSDLLIDTNIIIDALRKNTSAVEFMESITDRVNISIVTAAELIEGGNTKIEQMKIVDLIDRYCVENVSEEISVHALGLVKEYFLRDGLEYADALIASTCIMNDYKLVTRNIKHFDGIKDLEVYSPY